MIHTAPRQPYQLIPTSLRFPPISSLYRNRKGAEASRRTRQANNMALGDAWKQISWFYYQYLLVTALYMLEPWERTVFNSLLISVAAMAVYTGFVFMPQHIMAILHYFEVIQ
ncbi:hypothetical protein PHYPO_G00015740 [Pangasianodon hypophthalmus]|uniref:Serine palmitoyltransferase small subunit A n=2 Tax=Pangasianodon TaxID=30992 RepID=A0A5N5N4E3_PANHP|nr:hypothetical protein PHYPO_G00015740 [Pangasianodon hypophthalmus]